jgi:hypothetical protein
MGFSAGVEGQLEHRSNVPIGFGKGAFASTKAAMSVRPACLDPPKAGRVLLKMARSRARSVLRARAFLLALPLVGLAELGAHFWFAKRPPGFEEWATIREPVAAFAEVSAPVVVAPRWAEPLARQALGDERMPLSQVARADTSRFERAVELSILGQRAPELAGWVEEARETHGKFVLRRLKNPAYRPVVTDFVELARPPSAEVFMADPRGSEGETRPPEEGGPGGGKRPASPREACRWNPHAKVMSGGLGGNPTFPAERFECPAGPFFNVGVTVIADEEFLPRRCLWSHPPKSGELVTRFADVALGNTIEGHSGLYWMIERERKGAPVVLSVRVDGDEIGKVEHRDGDGFSRFELALGAHAKSPHATVEFGVSSPNYLHRHFCFEATSR